MTARTPRALRVLSGSHPERLNPNEPQPAIGAQPPPWLPSTGPARDAWDRLAPILTDLRVLTVADGEALAVACLALAELVEAQADATGWRRADAAAKRYLAALREFGLTPASRPRVSAQPADVADPLDAWLATPAGSPPPPEPPRPRRKPAEPSTDAFEAWRAT